MERILDMKFSDKKVIIFDLDGTLINSAPDLALAVNHMLKMLNRTTFNEDTIHQWVGNGAQTLVQRALCGKSEIDTDLDPALSAEALEIFLAFYAKNLCIATVTYPDVPSTLEALKNRGYTLAIVTNKPIAFVKPILSGLQIDGMFELYLGGDSLTKKKPDPMPLLHVAEKLSVTVNQCVMVGDSKNDILAAHAAQIQSIGLSYGYNYGEDIGNYNPDIVFDNFSDILTTFIDGK